MLSRNGEDMSEANMNLPTLAKICDVEGKPDESQLESELQHKRELPPVNSLLEKYKLVSLGYSEGSNAKIRSSMSRTPPHSISLPSFQRDIQEQQAPNVDVKIPNNLDNRGFQSSLIYNEPQRPASIVVPMMVPVLMHFNRNSSADRNFCPTYMIPPAGNEIVGVDGIPNNLYSNVSPETAHPYNVYPATTGLSSAMSTNTDPKTLYNFFPSPKGSKVLLNQPVSFTGHREYFYTPANTFGGRNPPIITENNLQGLCKLENGDQMHSSDERHQFTSIMSTYTPGNYTSMKPIAKLTTHEINDDMSKIVPENQHSFTKADQRDFVETDHSAGTIYTDDTSHKSSIERRTCPVCKKLCSRPSTLKTHLLIHSGALPHKCPFPNCHRRFNVKSNLTRHIRSRHKFDKS